MIAERFNRNFSRNFFSIAKSSIKPGRTMHNNTNIPMPAIEKKTATEYISLEARVAVQERSHPRVEAFQQHTRELARKVTEHLQLCATFLGQPTDEMHEYLMLHKAEIEAIWAAIELEQRVMLNDSSLERCHREVFDRYSKTAANLFLVSRIGVHLNRFIRLADPRNVFLARTPLQEATEQLLEGMFPLIKSLLHDSVQSEEGALNAQNCWRQLEEIGQAQEKTLAIAAWKKCLPSGDLRLLQAGFHAVSMGRAALQAIALEHGKPIITTLGGRAVNNNHDLLRPLS
jgi:hypothetical protein